jgi:hypothetical protein
MADENIIPTGEQPPVRKSLICEFCACRLAPATGDVLGMSDRAKKLRDAEDELQDATADIARLTAKLAEVEAQLAAARAATVPAPDPAPRRTTVF